MICIAKLLCVDSKPPPLVPAALGIRDALSRSAPIEHLRQRIADSDARLAAVLDLLPAELCSQIRAGPVDATGWSLLVSGAAAASKLRQLQPLIERRLAERGWQVSATRIRVQSAR
jgi:hypothetical protein